MRPEETTLCALDDLLVDGLRGVVHDDGAFLVVDFGVDAGVADEIDDPFFAFVLGEAEAGGEIPVEYELVTCSLYRSGVWVSRFSV